MAISLVSIVAMVGVFLWMIHKAKLASTRRMALLPLCCAAMEVLAAGILSPSSFPLLTVILIAMRTVILVCCVCAVRRDRILADRRSRRRGRRVANISSPVPYVQKEKVSERCA